MTTVQIVFDVLISLFSWPTILWLILGVVLGIIVGAIPGIGPAIGMAIILPFTFTMEGLDVIILFTMMYLGGMYGASISAILINTPGTAAAAATTLDGYPMSRKGKGIDALAMSATASSAGGLLTALVLIVIGPGLMVLVLLLGSPEYFLIALIGIAMITVVSSGALLKGIVAGSFGLAITTIGWGRHVLTPRYTLGTLFLQDGVSFVAVLIGLFAFSEMMRLSEESGGIAQNGGLKFEGNVIAGFREVMKRPVDIGKSALIGMIVGAVPGAGASVSNFVAYSEAQRTDNDPETFGDGNPRGVIAAEAANTGTTAGSIVPTIAFGIPGSAVTAILLGALIMHGLRPGPMMFTTELQLTYSVFTSLVVGNIIILAIGLFIITRMGYLTRIKTDLIIPVVIILAILGSFALRELWFDVITMIIFGYLGYYMKNNNYSIIALVLGVVLGPVAEENLHRSLSISGGSFSIFVSNPLSLFFVLILFLLLFHPLLSRYKNRIMDSIRS